MSRRGHSLWIWSKPSQQCYVCSHAQERDRPNKCWEGGQRVYQSPMTVLNRASLELSMPSMVRSVELHLKKRFVLCFAQMSVGIIICDRSLLFARAWSKISWIHRYESIHENISDWLIYRYNLMPARFQLSLHTVAAYYSHSQVPTIFCSIWKLYLPIVQYFNSSV